MSRIIVLPLILAVFTAPAQADSQMKQSPLLMRRAGPSCRPGNLGGEPGAGYLYRLGPCAGADPSATPDLEGGREAFGRGRQF